MLEQILEPLTYALTACMIVSLWVQEYRRLPMLVIIQTVECSEMVYYAIVKFVIQDPSLTFWSFHDIRITNIVLDICLLIYLWLELRFVVVNVLLMAHILIKFYIYGSVDILLDIPMRAIHHVNNIVDTSLIIALLVTSWMAAEEDYRPEDLYRHHRYHRRQASDQRATRCLYVP